MKQDAKDIARLQRKKERLPKGGPVRKKAVHALQHAYQRQANRRSDFAHQESRKLVNAYQWIVFEDLDIRGMQSEGEPSDQPRDSGCSLGSIRAVHHRKSGRGWSGCCAGRSQEHNAAVLRLW